MLSLKRLQLWVENAFWLIPLVGLLLAIGLSVLAVELDEALVEDQDVQRVIGPGAATTLLAAIGGGMVTFTGFVFSVVLLLLQFGSSAYSPRTVTYFLRGRTIQVVLGLFMATILFAFLSVLDVGSLGRQDFVPAGSVAIAILMLLLSMVGFLVLLNNVGHRVKVDAVLADVGRMARDELRSRFSTPTRRGAALLDRLPAPAPDAALVRHTGRPGQLVAVDRRRVLRLARRSGATIVLMTRTGDGLSSGSAIAHVSPGGSLSDRAVSRCLLVAQERSLRHDPLYALRILTDISLRALSPSTNDPTTAVRALDEVEGVLRAAAPLPLGPVEVRTGQGRVVLPSPSWPDVVDLALIEVVLASHRQPQVTRRLTALLNDLLADLPAERHPPLTRFKRELVDGVRSSFDAEQRAVAMTGDRQGIGGAR